MYCCSWVNLIYFHQAKSKIQFKEWIYLLWSLKQFSMLRVKSKYTLGRKILHYPASGNCGNGRISRCYFFLFIFLSVDMEYLSAVSCTGLFDLFVPRNLKEYFFCDFLFFEASQNCLFDAAKKKNWCTLNSAQYCISTIMDFVSALLYVVTGFIVVPVHVAHILNSLRPSDAYIRR